MCDLQATLDSVLTELDIARSLLASQRGRELRPLDAGLPGLPPSGGGGGGAPGPGQQQLLAFPVRFGSLMFDPEASGSGLLWSVVQLPPL